MITKETEMEEYQYVIIKNNNCLKVFISTEQITELCTLTKIGTNNLYLKIPNVYKSNGLSDELLNQTRNMCINNHIKNSKNNIFINAFSETFITRNEFEYFQFLYWNIPIGIFHVELNIEYDKLFHDIILKRLKIIHKKDKNICKEINRHLNDNKRNRSSEV